MINANMDSVDAAIESEESATQSRSMHEEGAEGKDWFPAVDSVMNLADCFLDVLWCLNVAGVALRPVIYVCASGTFYDALYGQPISTFITTMKFLLLPSFWIYVVEHYEILKTALLTVFVLAILKKVIDFAESGIFTVRWGSRTLSLRVGG